MLASAEAQVDRRVAAYANAQLRARGLNIARTEIMDALDRGVADGMAGSGGSGLD